MERERLQKLAADERFISGIYNYCDRWCERCPQTLRCLNFALLEEEFSDPEAQDMRNEAFWNKLSEILGQTLELLKESAKKWGVDIEALDSDGDTENLQIREEKVRGHLISRAAQSYAKKVEDWFKEREGFLLATTAGTSEEVNLEEAFEVIRWYQYFISVKLMRALHGKMEGEEEDDEYPSDSDGSAKIALIAIDRSISAWAVISHHYPLYAESVFEVMSFLDRLRIAVEETFPKARSFLRPGFDKIDLNE